MAEPVRAALAAAARALASVSDSARLDGELLMAHALGCTRDELLLRRLDDATPGGFAGLLDRRLAGEPLAYITGTRDFWTITLAVGPGVLIPRADSETLIEAAVAHFAGRAPPRHLLDLGTGPGTLLLAALSEWPGARGIGIDASPRALDFARANAEALGMADRAVFRTGDWAAGIDDRFDLILANPPYVATDEALGPGVREYEPGEALFAGADGLDDYRRIIPALPALIAPGGVAILEIGWRQGAQVSAQVTAAGRCPRIVHDLGSRPRAVVVT
ncbi:peptide chain release factor N(5)-glutamine methyltransferase [Sphingomonas sp.]|uniref:peptide chain release factor N(5)-glutamine methyltransferase n=1 Tax=Sphingomonas sp. TaxID=28214 RepID=UPI002CB3C011|nr:peptide chain release factor N(5)-glutamine methyltransferase [Sphingomonas sp.]HTG38555.1 peptide chain release factor N(5)-glutamine methyltransferase [Sphingomonas sp.]